MKHRLDIRYDALEKEYNRLRDIECQWEKLRNKVIRGGILIFSIWLVILLWN